MNGWILIFINIYPVKLIGWSTQVKIH